MISFNLLWFLVTAESTLSAWVGRGGLQGWTLATVMWYHSSGSSWSVWEMAVFNVLQRGTKLEVLFLELLLPVTHMLSLTKSVCPLYSRIKSWLVLLAKLSGNIKHVNVWRVFRCQPPAWLLGYCVNFRHGYTLDKNSNSPIKENTTKLNGLKFGSQCDSYIKLYLKSTQRMLV